jgi:hypothetical protein
MVRRQRWGYYLNQTQPLPAREMGLRYPQSCCWDGRTQRAVYRHSGMLAIPLQADKLYSSPGPCGRRLNSGAQGHQPCRREGFTPVHRGSSNCGITLSRRPLAKACKTGTPTVTGVWAGNGKWSGGWPPLRPAFIKGAQAPLLRVTQATGLAGHSAFCLLPRLKAYAMRRSLGFSARIGDTSTLTFVVDVQAASDNFLSNKETVLARIVSGNCNSNLCFLPSKYKAT